MSIINTLSPNVMINRIVAREATPAGAMLGRVADLRMRLEHAENEQQFRARQLEPTASVPPVLTGAEVDRLV